VSGDSTDMATGCHAAGLLADATEFGRALLQE
jgi:hypothetical protein